MIRSLTSSSPAWSASSTGPGLGDVEPSHRTAPFHGRSNMVSSQVRIQPPLGLRSFGPLQLPQILDGRAHRRRRVEGLHCRRGAPADDACDPIQEQPAGAQCRATVGAAHKARTRASSSGISNGLTK